MEDKNGCCHSNGKVILEKRKVTKADWNLILENQVLSAKEKMIGERKKLLQKNPKCGPYLRFISRNGPGITKEHTRGAIFETLEEALDISKSMLACQIFIVNDPMDYMTVDGRDFKKIFNLLEITWTENIEEWNAYKNEMNELVKSHL